MKDQEIEELRMSLQAKTGIDLSRFRTAELMATVADILVFPFYIAKALLLGLGVAGVLYVGFLGAQGELPFRSQLALFVWVVLGMVAVPVAGLAGGFPILATQLRGDLLAILDLAAELSQRVFLEINQVARRSHANRLELPSVDETMRAVLFVVMLPAAEAAARRKLPWLGRWGTRLLRRVVSWMLGTIMRGLRRGARRSSAVVPLSTPPPAQADSEQASAFCRKAVATIEWSTSNLRPMLGGLGWMVLGPLLFGYLVVLGVVGQILWGVDALLDAVH